MAQSAPNSLSIFSLLEILRRRKWVLLLCTALLTGGFWTFAHFQQDKYRATALIAAQQTTPPEYLKHVAPPPLNIEDHLWTVREVLFSDPVLEAAARRTKAFSSVSGNLTPQQIEDFKKGIGIKVDSEHSFQLTYDSGDPSEAMNVANTLADMFVERASAKSEQKTAETASVIDDQVDALKKRMEQQSRQIHDYKSKAVHALPDHMDDNIRAADTAREQLQDRETKIAEEEAKKASIQRELQDLESKGVLDQPLVREKTTDETKLDELKLQLADLQTRFTKDHPTVVAMKRQVADLERSIAAKPTKGRSEPSPTYLRYSQLKSELEGIDQRVAAYRRDQANLTAQMNMYTQRLESTPQHEKVIEDMDRELKVGELQFHALLDKQLDTKLAKGFEESESGIAFTIVEPAGLPQSPYSPQRARLILMGLAVGLGLGCALIFVLEQNDTTFGNVEDFQSFTTLPVAGVVPNFRTGKKKHRPYTSIVTIDDPESVAAEQYRILAMRVRQQCDAAQSKTIVVTSAAGGEGKSLTAINLATALASSSEARVLLIDADLRKPRMAEYLNLTVSADGGFHNLLQKGGQADAYVVAVRQLHVIPCGNIGHGNPVAVLSSPKARALFDQLKQQFDYIIVDAPPVLPIADSYILAGLADKVLFVVRARQTPRELFQHAIENFEAGNLLGAVLNDVDYQRSRYAYAYEYYKKAA